MEAFFVQFTSVYGVDFSGARAAGKNLWVAHATLSSPGARPRLRAVWNLGKLAGTDERGPVLRHLVRLIRSSEGAAWGMDFPFALPIEVMPEGTSWREQLAFVRNWVADPYAMGVEMTRRSLRLVGRLHIRRRTDVESKAPFDCYHYRIIYQTFYGMRDVLGPLARSAGTAILPFQYHRLARCRRIVVETCPASVLKRLGLPAMNYKQAAGGALTVKRRKTRRAIVEGLLPYLGIGAGERRIMMRNPGGDALDAAIAAAGAAYALRHAAHAEIRGDARYVREGCMYG